MEIIFIHSIFSGFLLLFVLSIFTMPIIDISKSIIFTNLTFFFYQTIYYNIFNKKFNLNFNEILNKKIILYENNIYYDCCLLNYKYKKILGIKYFLFLEILRNNNLLYCLSIDLIDKISLKNNNYYNLMFNLIYKYSFFFKKIDFYLANYIKDFLY